MAKTYSDEATRRAEIVGAARALYAEKGLRKTAVKDISDRVGVTRTLFYHYFPDKEAVTEAVIDSYVAEFVELAEHWDASRTPGDIDGALRSCIKVLRIGIFDNDSFHQDILQSENAQLYLTFSTRTVEALTDILMNTTVADYEKHHEIKIENVRETFELLLMGLVGLMRARPDISDEVLTQLIMQTLRMDL